VFVVAGVTGRTGAVVAETLLERRQPTRVLVRHDEKGRQWKRRGAQVAVASLADADALTSALNGADGLYVLVPFNPRAEDFLGAHSAMVDAIASAVRTRGLRHTVLLSAIGAHLPSGTGPIAILYEAEQKLRAAVRGLSLVRAPFFMENWLPLLPQARTEGVLTSFLSPRRKIAMIAASDIGHIAAECLLDQATGIRTLELSGPREYSPRDVAALVAARWGAPARVKHAAWDAMTSMLEASGFSKDAARLYQEMYQALDDGRIVPEDNGSCRPRGLVTLDEALFGASIEASATSPKAGGGSMFARHPSDGVD
jgi:uncharacterized protein YbjT (DUF2867 family)